MSAMLAEVAIGAVVRNGKLTTVTRIGTQFDDPLVEAAEAPDHAASALLKLKGKLRRTCSCDPVVHLAGGHVGGRTIALLREHDSQSADRLIEGAGPAHTCAPGGAEYANRHAEIADRFLTDMHAEKLLLASSNELQAELLAFERGERNGKIGYPSPDDVADTIGHYPAQAVATMLASIPAPPPGAEPSEPKLHDPYADI